MRTIIEISDKLASDLDAFCKAREVTRISVIREALAMYLEMHGAPKPLPEEHFGSWANRPGDSLVIEAAYREEW